jgi:hypothetical protein
LLDRGQPGLAARAAKVSQRRSRRRKGTRQ